jgi:hypothetical protein
MNIVILILLLNIIAAATSKFAFNNYTLNRLSLRYIVFKEKIMAKIMKKIANKIHFYHTKSVVSVAEGITTYTELSEDEKTLIETIISLCY